MISPPTQAATRKVLAPCATRMHHRILGYAPPLRRPELGLRAAASQVVDVELDLEVGLLRAARAPSHDPQVVELELGLLAAASPMQPVALPALVWRLAGLAAGAKDRPGLVVLTQMCATSPAKETP